jgi:ribosomal-protein-serine acetyltransferase
VFSHPIDERSALRLLEARHAEALFRQVDANRDHLRAWLPWVDATRSPDDSRVFIESSLQRFARANGFDAGIWHGAERVGGIGLHAVDGWHRTSSIGYWIAREHEGRGLVTAACRAVLDHAFAELGLNRIEIRCEPDNRRSRAIPERLGFRVDGTLRHVQRIDERYTDLVVYSMLADEWRARKDV